MLRLRRHLRRLRLLTVASALGVLGVSTPAFADEPTAPTKEVTTTAFTPGYRALVEGRFSDAADAFAAIAAPLDPTDAKAAIAAELHRIAAELKLRGVTLVRVDSPLRARASDIPTRTADMEVPPYDRAMDQITDGQVYKAEETLRTLLSTARDPIELAVARVMYAVTEAWIKNGVVPIAIPTSNSEGIVPRADRGRWYGWQVSAIDVAAITTISLVGAFNQDISTPTIRGTIAVAAVVLVAGPAVVHLGHGRSKAGVYSLASRSLFFFTGALVGAMIMTPFALASSKAGAGQYLPLGGAGVGAGIGLIGAMAFDSAALAYEPRETPAPTPLTPKTSSSSKSIHPFAIPLNGSGVMAGFGGTL